MERNIIKVTSNNDNTFCMICSERNASTKIKIRRLSYNDTILNLYVCDKCLAKMQREIEICK